MKRYINRQSDFGKETVDEFPYNNRTERKYAHAMLNEYRISDQWGSYYLSQRACKEYLNS